VITPPFYPARPVNGGPLPKALPKSGDWTLEGKYNGWRAWVHNPTRLMFNRKLEPLSIRHEFANALGILHSLPWEWSDVEALERRHKIGQGSLILLDTPIAGDYATRRGIINGAASANGIPEHIHADEPIEHDRVYLPLTMRNSLGRTSELLFWQILQTANAKLGGRSGSDFWEGVVAKRNNSNYPTQRRNSELDFPFWMKHRWAF
jgi:hypothetical protein